MCVLIEEWKFALPMSSAILTVLYPEEFTVYDYKVCNQLGFPSLKNDYKFTEELWKGYRSYCMEVEAKTPKNLRLRDKDRYLWGQYSAEKLEADIKKWQERSK
jgi:hypothetical protein